MRKLKTLFISILVILSVCSFAMFTACNNGGNDNQTPTTTQTIKLDQTVLLMEIGESKTLTATSSDKASTFSWISFDSEIVSVDNGTITALKEGTTTVVVYIDDVRAYCTITVKDGSDANLTLSPDGTLSYKKGETEKLTIDLYDGASKLKTLATDYTAESLELHDLIVDYRIENSVTEDKAYTIKVKGSKVEGEIKTGTYRAIDTLEKLKAAIAAANQAKPDYMYLTADIVIEDVTPASDNTTGGLFMLTTVETMPVFLNFDGKGHSISYGEAFLTSVNNGNQDEDNGENEDDCRTLFGMLKESKIKNLVFDLAIEVEHASTGLVAFYTQDVEFTDCYFKVALSQLGGSYSNALFKGAKTTDFTNCVFELIDLNVTDLYDVHLTGHESADTTFTNCATIYNGNQSFVGEIMDIISQQANSDSITIKNFNLYSTVGELVSAEKDDNTWSSSWTFDGANGAIKLLDKVVATGSASNPDDPSTPTVDGKVDKNGLLDFAGMTGERTVVVNDGTVDVITKTVPASAESFDVYDAIIDYREQNSILGTKYYFVKITCGETSKTLETAIFNPISTTAEFRAAVDRKNEKTDNVYFYLTTDIGFDEPTAGYGTGYKTFCSAQNQSGAPSSWKEVGEAYLNLDGRGYALKVSYNNPNGGDRWMFDHIIDSNFKNVVVDFNVELYYVLQATFANSIQNSTFENCYFAITLKCGHPSKSGTRYFAYTLDEVTFDNCVFDLTDNSADKSTPIKLSRNNSKVSLINNAISFSDQNGLESLFDTYSSSNVDARIYSDMTDLITAESTKSWNSVWAFDSANSAVKLFDKTIA